jgi:peptide/nickel transport system substrate-binding protein
MHKLCLISIVVCALISGCTPAAPPNTLIYGRSEDANTLDPVNTEMGEAVNVIVNIYDTLVTYDDVTTELVPSLAEKWEHSEDGLRWTFHLRPNVKFHDGTVLTADAVKTSFDRLLQPTHPLLYDELRPYQMSYKVIQEVQTDGDLTVVFILREPSAVFLQNLTMFPASIVSPAAVKERGKGFAEKPCGTGPFQMVTWSRDEKLVLGAFKDHWRGPPGVDTLIWVPFHENQTRIAALQRGEVHIADNLSGFDVEPLKGRNDITVLNEDSMNVCYLAMQTEKTPLNRQDVRQAIWMAIDKQELCRVGYAGQASPAASMVPETMWGHAKFADREFNPTIAKEMLEAAAKDGGFSLPLRVTLAHMVQARPYLMNAKTVGGFIKDSLQKIGIEVTLEPRDANEHFEHLRTGDFELALAGWRSDNNDPDNFLYSLLDPDSIANGGNNVSRFRNDEFHQLLLQGQRELDPAQRLVIYQKAQEIAFAEAPVVPLVYARANVAMSKRVKGYKLHPTGMVRLRLARLEAAP